MIFFHTKSTAQKIMQRLIHFFLFLFLSVQYVFADENSKHLRFGVLAYRPKEITAAQWLPLANEIQQALPNYTIELLPLNYPELDKAAKEQQLDFVLTNPEHYILLKNVIGMNAVATLITLEKGHPLTHFAGVVFTRAERTDIQKIADLNGKKIAAPAEQSLGGYLMERWELEKNNVTAKEYLFTGMPHDKVVDEVLLGNADAGFVRTGILEHLENAGKITLGENATIRVISPRPINDAMPVLHSTDSYPEWAFSVRKDISVDISQKVSLLLLNIKPDSDVAKAAGIAGFNSPADYTPVEVLMLRLRAHPDELKYFNFSDVVWRYREGTVIFLVVSFSIVTLIIFLVRANRKSKRIQKQLNESYAEISLLLNSMAEGAYGVTKNGRCRFVNASFLKILGYEKDDEIIGKHIHELIHHSLADGTHYPYTECQMYHAYKQEKSIHVSNEVFWRKDGRAVPVEYWSQPITVDNVFIGAITTFIDITERKKTEEEIRKLAFFDALTNLPNRRKLIDRLKHSIILSQRENKKFAVFMLDLDKFKAVNDSLGHTAGDDLLKQVAYRITKRLRGSDMVSRLGGDEFVIVLENIDKVENVTKVILTIISDLTDPFKLLSGNTVKIGASIGVSFYPAHGDTPEQLIDNADTALYLAKQNGRGGFVYYGYDKSATTN